MENFWVKVYADEVFPAIDEKCFSILYGTKASELNTSIIVVVGAFIIKKPFNYTDDEIMENLVLNFRTRYTLYIQSFEK